MVFLFNKRSTGYLVSKPSKNRNTIVDLLKVVGGKARPGYLLFNVDMSYSSSLLKKLKAHGVKATVTSVLIKAIAIAQQYHSKSRTESIPFGSLVTYSTIVAGFTVERLVDGQPTVFLGEIIEPNKKSISQISDELKYNATAPIEDIEPMRLQKLFSSLPAFARQLILILGRSFPALRLKCQKASFGLTSLGKHGVLALLSPCLCSSTFGIGKMEKRPVVIDKKIEIQEQMTISLNFDLRAFDYNDASEFLNTVQSLLEGELEQYLTETEALTSGITNPKLLAKLSQ